ncbi:SpoIIE family protein phosphatase [Actinomadura formosensis]|uniref:SpoIIE family protein phosphatase n=1 Tax=Actinomadura formosensis TaxID=60706 RepID=UPI0008318FF3|nr:SpoIIE family protein phosphatase [Actinomadura formosensis]
MEPEVTVTWPEETLPELGSPEGLPADRLMDELGGLWPLLGPHVRRTGHGCLWPGSLRWDEACGWQILSIPPYGASTQPVPETPGARERDAWAVASDLLTVAAGRPPRDAADAEALLDLHAGIFPHGLDAVVHAILRRGEPARVHGALKPRPGGPVAVRAAAETAVGSRKAKGDPLWDNEDAFTVVRMPKGGLAMVVCDGVTGAGDGSGARAARAAKKALEDGLAEEPDPQIALGIAERAVLRDAPTGASTVLIVRAFPDGRLELTSLGDSSAWLVRPLRKGGHLAMRLTPAQTALAEKLLTDPGADSDGSRLTQHLGGEADQPYLGTVRAVAGDRVALLSDGAAVADGTAWFGADLAALATDHPRPAALAAALVARAERLGGRDNATAVIAEIRALD